MSTHLSFRQFDAELMISYDSEASEILNADHYRVKQSFRYYIGSLESGEWINIPAGYLTDGASVPRILWNVVSPWGKHGQAVVVHDHLCEYLTVVSNGELVSITRKRADEILAEAMAVLEVKKYQQHIINKGVALYRFFANPQKPSNNPVKRELEAKWAAAQM